MYVGTRIVYDRQFLLKCRASPHANTPPKNLPDIPGVTLITQADKQKTHHVSAIKEEPELRVNTGIFWKQFICNYYMMI